MPLYEYLCDDCRHEDERIIKLDDLERYVETCPKCQGDHWHRTFKKAPPGRIKGDHAHETGRMQQSLRERFVRTGGMDEVRHKHGSAFDDSLRGAAVDRIKEGKAP